MEENIDEFIGVKGKEIHDALENLRKNEIMFKVGELKAKLPNLGRCVICTLRLPCKHFTSVNQMPKVQEPEMTQTLTSSNFNVTDYLPKLTPESHKRGFSVRYKGQRTEYNFDFNRRQTSLPNEKRIKQLEIIESYREEKLKKEIEKINAMKEQEKKQKELEKKSENLRRQHILKQKQMIEEYKVELAEKNSQIQEMLKLENESKKKEVEKYQLRVQEIKEKIKNYQEKKEMIQKISKQKIKDLENDVINYKPIRIKYLK